MNMRLFAVLFAGVFLIGIAPVLLFQPYGSASAGVMSGFLQVINNPYIIAGLFISGVLGVCLKDEAVLIIPLCTLLVLATGSLISMPGQVSAGIRDFILGAIILFSLCIALVRRKKILLYITPVSVAAFFSGGVFMQNIPSIATPLFAVIGTLVGAALVMAIGIASGVTLVDPFRQWTGRLKISPAFAVFLSLF